MRWRRIFAWAAVAALAVGAGVTAQDAGIGAPPTAVALPPCVAQARQFLAQRGWSPASGVALQRSGTSRRAIGQSVAAMSATAAATSTWQSLGPAAVTTPGYGLVTGRVTAVALDPADQTGNRLYVGTTGGGVWVAQNAGTSSTQSIVFTPLTDAPAALSGVLDASISIGALTVQPGGTGVLLAGTGDPNDVLDSYYGAGILRSTDGGSTWSLVARTSDVEQGLGAFDYKFTGEGFAGFAWSTKSPQVVVAAVSHAYEGMLVNAVLPGVSYAGLYYSNDSGATWHLATISDGSGSIVQGPLAALAGADGNAATSVVWNPVRKVFVAAVRYHGYYQSADGVTWTRMAAQPGAGLTTAKCPTNIGSTGSVACPIYRGTLAVNPSTGDTFAWTVDGNDQDQGLWQDQCAVSGGACSNQSITFGKQWSTAALQTSTVLGAATILDGTYTLALAAVPSAQDTIVLAGGDDVWKCSLASGCVWRNTTNATTCMSAKVGEYQHALAWSADNPLEMFVGNDSGLWRSMDAIGETGAGCSTSDAQHFQNLNGGLGSLAEVVSLSGVASTPYTLMAGLGVNGTAGVKSTSATSDWPQILGGYGGPVAIDPADENKWYVNTQSGVGIYRCSQAAPCTAKDFGTSPVVNSTDVGGDGLAMVLPAPFLVDPLDSSQLLVGTCRVWRGSGDGSAWSSTNAISPILDTGSTKGSCSGDAQIRSMAAMALPSGGERVYVGMYGSLNGGANLPGHVLSATVNPASGTPPVWSDLTLGPVTNDSNALNKFGMDISSIYIDPHDTSGNTVYVTVEGAESTTEEIQVVYRSTDAGAHWTDLMANLPDTPVSSIVVDPQDANTVYLATDEGVYFTTRIASCAVASSICWSVFGAGLPEAPVVALSASPAGAAQPVLVAGTYGRGIWQTPLWTAGTSLTTASLSSASLTFASQPFGTTSAAQTVTLQNTGSNVLTVTGVAMSGDFSESDTCLNASVAPGASCAIQVKFTPTAIGSRTGAMTISANVYGGQLTAVQLSGNGQAAAGAVSLTPASLDFGQVTVGTTSASLPAQAANNTAVAVSISSVTITAPFTLASNSCGTASLAANTTCQIQVAFAPTQAGAATGTLTLVDAAGTQTVALSGTGTAAATDSLSPTSLSFTATPAGTLSAAQTVTLTNSGDATLTAIAVSVSGAFQTSNTCGTQLTGHASCAISVVFAPTQAGSLTGTLTVADALRTQTVALAGTGLSAPVISVSPVSLSFATQQAGVASAPQTLTVTNTGGSAMANVGFQITGSAAASYAITATSCGATLNSNASCTAQIVFTPAATGSIAATLTVSSSTMGVAAVTVPLNGAGQLTSGVGSVPAQLNFSTVGVGQSSTAQAVTITNSSNYAIGSLTLAVNAPFSLSQNNCTSGLASGANCTAAVIFQPTASGAASGALTVSSAALAVPASVALSGTGFDFAAGVQGTSSMTVAAGQIASYTLTINPANGAGGTFTYTCGNLPANAVCTFNPATTTISTGATGSLTLSIATGKAGSARLESPMSWHVAPLACGLVLVPIALMRRRRALLLLALLVIVIGGSTSCSSSGGGSGGGGSGGGSGSGSATPPGTYSIPVTVVSTGVSHVVTVTLVVD